jgi:hypothetical protein
MYDHANAIIIARFLRHMADLDFTHFRKNGQDFDVRELANDLDNGEASALELVHQSMTKVIKQ